jgi:hypothetical protein
MRRWILARVGSFQFHVENLIVEFNGVSKSGLEIEIGQYCVKIQLISRQPVKVPHFIAFSQS